jgi:type II secretory pathway pseudopilin PulG
MNEQQGFIRQIHRLGMSLVELLIVIAIIVSVTAVVLPTLKESLKDQKITQASRQLQGMIDACKAQAMASGRPVGISLERLGGESAELASSVIQVVRVEELPPYTGDFQDAGAFLEFLPNNATFSLAMISQRDAMGLMNIAGSGDYISFGDLDERFEIKAIGPASFQPPGGILEPFFQVEFFNGYGQSPFPPLLYKDSKNRKVKVPFRLYRRPVRNELFVLQLPKNICLDLSCSGFASSSALNAGGVEFSPKAISSPNSPQYGANIDFGPITILFAPNGNIWRVGIGARTVLPVNDVYLLMGRLDRVSPVNELSPYFQGTASTDGNALQGNLMSSDSLWIKISRSGGRVTSTHVDGILSPVTALAERLYESRETARLGVTRGAK